MAVVVVVDDNARNRAVVKGYLGDAHSVIEAADGAAAVKLVSEAPVDLVLLDVMMPGMNGYDTCRALKAASAGRYLPIIMVTALGDQQDRNTGLEAGADDFLTKPVDRRELVLRVNVFVRLSAQDQLIRRQVEELRNLDALKDDLMSLLVHDLRNPLTGIMGVLHAMQDELTDDELKQDVALALSGASRLQETLEELLQVRLLEEGKLLARREELAVRVILDETAALVEGAARQRNVRLCVEGDSGLRAELDPKLTRRSVENLLVNAVKYSRTGEAVDVSASLDPEGAVVIDVADRGAGIPDPVRGTLFQKFAASDQRLEHPARRGFGLGLYLVQLTATAHGGTVQALDREGGGSILRLRLPRA